MASTRRQRAQRHARHAYYCSCGKVVFGNGGKASHAWMHERRGEWKHPTTGAPHAATVPNGHHYLTYSAFLQRERERTQ